eukprot:NODE_73_length_24441_cov_0.672952.p16 type:complete len:162 gc:universal NODE_73_length_24441_cov_0.672952:21724-21239(-)
MDALLRGLHHGFRYGSKVRAPHSLVMTLLFKRDSLPKMLEQIIKLTLQHAIRLGCFGGLFRFARSMIPSPHIREILPGFVFGCLCFGDHFLSQQVVMYLLSRNIYGLFATLNEKYNLLWFNNQNQRVVAGLNWAMVMWLFYHYPKNLQASLRTSMEYIYLQ